MRMPSCSHMRPNWVRATATFPQFALARLSHIDALPVRVQGTRHPVALDPSPQHMHRCPRRLLLVRAELEQRFRGRIIDQVHQAVLPSPFLQPAMETAVHLHQLAEMRLRLSPLPVWLASPHRLLPALPKPAPQRLSAYNHPVIAGQMFARQRRTKIAVAFAVALQNRRTKLQSVTAVGLPTAAAMLQRLGPATSKPCQDTLRLPVADAHQLRRLGQTQAPGLHPPHNLNPIQLSTAQPSPPQSECLLSETL